MRCQSPPHIIWRHYFLFFPITKESSYTPSNQWGDTWDLFPTVIMSESRPETKGMGKPQICRKKQWQNQCSCILIFQYCSPHVSLNSYIRILIIKLLNYGGFQLKWVLPTQPWRADRSSLLSRQTHGDTSMAVSASPASDPSGKKPPPPPTAQESLGDKSPWLLSKGL